MVVNNFPNPSDHPASVFFYINIVTLFIFSRAVIDKSGCLVSSADLVAHFEFWNYLQRWIFLRKQEPGFLDDFFILVQLYSNQGVSCRNIGQEQLRVTQSCGARQTIWIQHGSNDMYYKKETQMVPSIMEKQAKQCIMWYSADLASFLFNCAFFGVRAEILLTRDKVSLESRAGPFLGFVKKY